MSPSVRRAIAFAAALVVARAFPSWWCGRDAGGWLRGEPELHERLAEELVAFEASDDAHRSEPARDRFAGEWALVTHQMTALGLAQLCLARLEGKQAEAKVAAYEHRSSGP